MDPISCKVCCRAYCEEICVPKLLECGHSVCFTCFAGLIQDNESCPTCGEDLSKTLEKYPINIDLKISKSCDENDFQDLYRLGKKKSLLLSQIEMLMVSINVRDSLKDTTNGLIDNIKELALVDCESANTDVKKLVSYIDRHIELVNNVLSTDFSPKKQNMFFLSQYKNEQHYISDLKFRLIGGEIVFSCEFIGRLGWKYGQVTIRDDRLYIHCLCSSTLEYGASLVLLRDVRKCLISNGNIMPFIDVGREKMVFQLIDDSSVATLQLIKLCTGEGGQYLKGCNTSVEEYIPGSNGQCGLTTKSSSKLNRCSISVPTNPNECVYEHMLMKNIGYIVTKDDVILQYLKGQVFIHRVIDPSVYKYYNVVAKLHEDFSIDFNNLKRKKVDDSGISFAL